ncbi:NYN domain-containing protein [Leptothrix cholodnii]|uniref:NYN domain-containing protein n=1 Tax=Leptothrix cholodnii TaxID=34029 RepID=UPI001CB7A818|nr:NYN domain-containing protein [Leptothrix cholodnii]
MLPIVWASVPPREQPADVAFVAVLVDCDNTAPDVLEHALRVVAQFGQVVLRRGYSSHTTLANKWQEALVRLAFTPCLQFQYAAGKNTSDIALALDALEAMFDRRSDTFCLVTSDSDFAYLGGLGQYLKRTDPAFSPKTDGHCGLLDMLRTYDLLVVQQEPGGHWTVRLEPRAEGEEG